MHTGNMRKFPVIYGAMKKAQNSHRVGIIPFETEGDAVALLFVTSQTRGRWIFPKGRQKPGETHIEACHREGFEEAGVRGTVLEDYPCTVVIGKQSKTNVKHVPVTYYPFLVQKQEDSWPEMDRRLRHWALLEHASRVAYRDDYLILIQQFQALQDWIRDTAERHKFQPPEKLIPAQ